jgi:hypothetical protein
MMSNASVPAVWGSTVWGVAVALTARATAAPSGQTLKAATADTPKRAREGALHAAQPGLYAESSAPGSNTGAPR